jgi:dihydropteroate synthase
MVRSGSGLKPLRVRDTAFEWGTRTYVMGIVNVTNDSFSGDGIAEPEAASTYAVDQWRAGSDILDFGGQSTRPGHQPVDAAIERERVVPAIAAARQALPGAAISVDTFDVTVLRAARAAGADIVNCVWGAPAEILDAAGELEMPLVIMHNQNGTQYDGSVVYAVLSYLEKCAGRAVRSGFARERIVLDPGIGFGKTAEHNLEILAALPRLVALGFPTLIGASRKSTIGKLTGREPQDRVYGSVAICALAIGAGIDVVRVHDVAAARDAVSVCDAIVRKWRPPQWTA